MYHKTISSSDDVAKITSNIVTEQNIEKNKIVQEPKEQHLSFKENQKGITYDSLFGAYLKGATKITITDPYIRIFFQAKNLMELIETIINNKTVEDIVNLHLITIADDKAPENQLNFFEQIQLSAQIAGVIFTWEFDTTETIHARSIVTNTGWKISLDRGLDIFQPYAINDTFSLTNRLQQYRKCKAFEVTYIKEGVKVHFH